MCSEITINPDPLGINPPRPIGTTFVIELGPDAGVAGVRDSKIMIEGDNGDGYKHRVILPRVRVIDTALKSVDGGTQTTYTLRVDGVVFGL